MKKFFSLIGLLFLSSCFFDPAYATVNDTSSRQIYNANGSTTVFSAPFRILDQTQIRVILYNTLTATSQDLILGTNFSVQNVGSASTQVTTLSTYAAGYQLIFLRNVPPSQLTQYVANDPFPAASHEAALDKLTMREQQDRDLLTRIPAWPEYAPLSLQPQLPLPQDGKLLYWSGTTGQLANSLSSITDFDTATTGAAASAAASAASASSSSAFATNAASSATAAAASATLAAAQSASLQGTSTSSNTIGTGNFTFTTQASKAFNGQFITVASTSSPSNNMFGTATYSGTTMTFTEISNSGSGTFSSWTLSVAGARGAIGATGATGPAGSGAGDMLKANNLSDLTSASTARTNLGLGSLATQSASGVTITGGTITNITDLLVADGGTGSSTAAGARTNLGLTSAATATIGTSANNLVQLDGSAKLPAVDGSQLTNLPNPGGFTSTSSYIILGSVTLEFGSYSGGANKPTITFPVAFSGAPYSIQVTPQASGSASGATITSSSASSFVNNQFNTNSGAILTAPFFWFAVGPS